MRSPLILLYSLELRHSKIKIKVQTKLNTHLIMCKNDVITHKKNDEI